MPDTTVNIKPWIEYEEIQSENLWDQKIHELNYQMKEVLAERALFITKNQPKIEKEISMIREYQITPEFPYLYREYEKGEEGAFRMYFGLPTKMKFIDPIFVQHTYDNALLELRMKQIAYRTMKKMECGESITEDEREILKFCRLHMDMIEELKELTSTKNDVDDMEARLPYIKRFQKFLSQTSVEQYSCASCTGYETVCKKM